jgi:hypothetical protein
VTRTQQQAAAAIGRNPRTEDALERRSISMKIQGEKADRLKRRAVMELKLYLVVAAYLFTTFSGFTIHTALVAADHRVDYEELVFNIIEAFILGKVIVVGNLLNLRRRFSHGPLILSALYNALVFSLFLFAFAVVERLVKGLIHGETVSAMVQAFVQNGTKFALAKAVIMFLNLVPFFAIWEAARIMGEERMIDMFFSRRVAGDERVPTPEDRGHALREESVGRPDRADTPG